MPGLSAPSSVTTKTVSRPAPDGMGNGLFATEALKVGEDVLHAKTPFVAVLDSPRLDDTCSGCFGRKQMEGNAELKACTGCRVVKYCDRVSPLSTKRELFILGFDIGFSSQVESCQNFTASTDVFYRPANLRIGNSCIQKNVLFSKI